MHMSAAQCMRSAVPRETRGHSAGTVSSLISGHDGELPRSMTGHLLEYLRLLTDHRSRTLRTCFLSPCQTFGSCFPARRQCDPRLWSTAWNMASEPHLRRFSFVVVHRLQSSVSPHFSSALSLSLSLCPAPHPILYPYTEQCTPRGYTLVCPPCPILSSTILKATSSVFFI